MLSDQSNGALSRGKLVLGNRGLRADAVRTASHDEAARPGAPQSWTQRSLAGALQSTQDTQLHPESIWPSLSQSLTP